MVKILREKNTIKKTRSRTLTQKLASTIHAAPIIVANGWSVERARVHPPIWL